MRWQSLVVVVVPALVALGAAGLLGRSPRVTGESQAPGSSMSTADSTQSVGVGGCASAGCHGGSAALAANPDRLAWMNSATHWLAVDPHTKAYSALETPLATAIMKRLQSNQAATEDIRCLACHTNPSLATGKIDAREAHLRSDGVSCEACHGDAGKWVSRHASWSAANRGEQYERHGMAKLYDLGERAAMCAGCHVGAPADPARGYPVRDMNHDMIAAGHPRLNFDFADYQRRLSPHWFEEDQSPEFEVRAWLVGRVAHQESALLLHEDRRNRAKANDSRTPWPEFADWNCVSCHHPIGAGFPGSTGQPQRPSIWPPVDAGRGAVEVLAEALKTAPVNVNDRESACLVYFALAARERSRMKREGRTTYDPAFDRLSKSLSMSRGNLDFTVKPEAIADLKALLK